ncbi:RICIN domain-containing protein [Amycolatopsis sp. NPDC049253]|uniref:RICIN domain-containing protein n=1 Tax=Amycolatopsis sp. NPDC049253 TaxID=3155274 RepID=UPI00341C883D
MSRIRALILVLVLAAATLGFSPGASAQVIPIDGASPGRTFDGAGAISGGGGNSRLLIDYPEPYRSQVLDYLFKPGYGASLQILKVEIGGDTNSTSGAESSHEHTAGDLDCGRGYEWWLMGQAKKRDPGIKLSALAWGAPGFVGSFWSDATISYLLDWLGCARSHGLTIDYLGGWNEKGYDKAFYEKLHAALRSHGYATLVVGADTDWQVADDMLADPEFAASVDVIGAHYPCGYKTAMTTCASSVNAVATGKPLSASENGSEDYNSGAAAVARAINRGYLDAKMTSYLNWPLVAATYPTLPFGDTALMRADQPWSGSFDVGEQLWAMAHTTQFTRPGWRYVDSASGYFGGDRANGSFVTYQEPGHTAYSVVAETFDATAPKTVTFRVTGGLPAAAPVHVWSSDLKAANFVREPDLRPSGGTFTVTLQPGRVYSLTTTSGQGAGRAVSPARASLAMPYSADFDHDPLGTEPPLFAQQQGAFETVSCGQGQCLRQRADAKPVNWNNITTPYTLAGDIGWTDYTVSVDARFEQPGSVQLLGRIGTQRWFNPDYFDGYYLEVSDTGTWSLIRKTAQVSKVVLASGTVAAPGLGSRPHLALSFDGPKITVAIDGTTVGQVVDGTHPAGQVGLGVGGYQTEEFDNLSVTPIGHPAPMNAYRIVAGGEALTSEGHGVVRAPFDPDSLAQRWELTDRQTLTNLGTGAVVRNQPLQNWSLWPVPLDGALYVLTDQQSGNVLDVAGKSTADGAAVVETAANGGAINQRWRLVAAGDGYFRITNLNSGKALESVGGRLVQNGASDSAGQRWKFAEGRGGSYTLVNEGAGAVAGTWSLRFVG